MCIAAIQHLDDVAKHLIVERPMGQPDEIDGMKCFGAVKAAESPRVKDGAGDLLSTSAYGTSLECLRHSIRPGSELGPTSRSGFSKPSSS
jgi:hypothetical protein